MFQKASKAEDKNNVLFSRDEYFKVIVSFWKVNFQTNHRHILCLGGLIGSNWIITTKDCDHALHPIKEIGVISGSEYFIGFNPKFIIHDRINMHLRSHFALLVVSNSA